MALWSSVGGSPSPGWPRAPSSAERCRRGCEAGRAPAKGCPGSPSVPRPRAPPPPGTGAAGARVGCPAKAPPLGGTAWPGKRFPPTPGSTSKNQREPHWTRPTGKSGVTQRGLGRSLHHCSHGTRVGGAPHAEPVDRHCLALQTKCPARGRLAHDTKSREDYGVSDRGQSTNAAANRCRSHRTRVLRRAP